MFSANAFSLLSNGTIMSSLVIEYTFYVIIILQEIKVISQWTLNNLVSTHCYLMSKKKQEWYSIYLFYLFSINLITLAKRDQHIYVFFFYHRTMIKHVLPWDYVMFKSVPWVLAAEVNWKFTWLFSFLCYITCTVI